MYLTDSTRTFISGSSFCPIIKSFQWLFVFETVWNQAPYLSCLWGETFATKVHRNFFIRFSVDWLLMSYFLTLKDISGEMFSLALNVSVPSDCNYFWWMPTILFLSNNYLNLNFESEGYISRVALSWIWFILCSILRIWNIRIRGQYTFFL